MKLNAFVKHKFDRGFLLKDEDLTKLLDFVKVRAKECGAADLVKIKVYRADSLVYESQDMEALRAEENAARNRVTRLQVLVEHTELKVDFDFDAEEDVSIGIEANSRDRAYLLFSELKEYLNTEVLILRRGHGNSGSFFLWAMLPLIAMLCCMMVPLGFQIRRHQAGADQFATMLRTDDTQAKLNYLIKHSEIHGSNFFLWSPVCILFCFVHPMVRWLQRLFCPRNIFYFGKEKQRYDAAVQRRSRWLWGVVIGLIISFAGSLAVWFLPARGQP